MLSGTPEDMKRIESEGKLDQWCDDNLDWLRKTYGKENVVSAVLHLDEKTPHIHATVVPIVTTERKKKKSEMQVKKRYRTKSRTAARLCLDDVMSREKLKEYQTTYAETMAKYGLHRGINGSEARHISTSQWYRELFAQKEDLQEDVASLLEQRNEAYDKVRDMYDRKDEVQEKFLEMDQHVRKKAEELSTVETKLEQVNRELNPDKLREDFQPYARIISQNK